MPNSGFPSPAVALEDLLGGVVRGIVAAQRELDQAAVLESERSVLLPDGEVPLRPVWFVFERTRLDLELSTFVADSTGGASGFQCRPLDPAAVALRGYAAASGARLQLEIAPLGAAILRRDGTEPETP